MFAAQFLAVVKLVFGQKSVNVNGGHRWGQGAASGAANFVTDAQARDKTLEGPATRALVAARNCDDCLTINIKSLMRSHRAFS